MISLFRTVTSLLVLAGVSYAQNWQLVWSDEFDGPSSTPNPANWNYDTGGGGWGNNEIQYHTDRRENSYVQDGHLIIEAREEKFRNRKYTSARLKSQGLRESTYGKFEARIRIPGAQGSWPAFWMLGANFVDVGWPDCGEIDIMEWVWDMEDSPFAPTMGNVIRGSAHGPGYFGANSKHGDWKGGLSDDFHIYAAEWTPSQIRYYVDGFNYYTLDKSSTSPWVFDHDFFIILNLALGGWGGPVASTVRFPINMTVDYVHVYEDTEAPPPPPPPPGQKQLLLSNIEMSFVSKGPNTEAVATVTVVDEDGTPVSGVLVNGSWSGIVTVGVNQATTNSNGVTSLNSGKTKVSGTVRFCVTDLEKAEYAYSPNVMEEHCDDIVI